VNPILKEYWETLTPEQQEEARRVANDFEAAGVIQGNALENLLLGMSRDWRRERVEYILTALSAPYEG
jgi:hypothetical protein